MKTSCRIAISVGLGIIFAILVFDGVLLLDQETKEFLEFIALASILSSFLLRRWAEEDGKGDGLMVLEYAEAVLRPKKEELNDDFGIFRQ